MTTSTDSLADQMAADIDVVAAGFARAAAGDMPGFAATFHPDAVWNHRNEDHLGGKKIGVAAIVDFLAKSFELTTGTLRPVPRILMGDGHGHVAVLTSISGTRPDGRTFDDTQILYFVIDDGRARTVDQFVGEPAAVTAFWA